MFWRKTLQTFHFIQVLLQAVNGALDELDTFLHEELNCWVVKIKRYFKICLPVFIGSIKASFWAAFWPVRSSGHFYDHFQTMTTWRELWKSCELTSIAFLKDLFVTEASLNSTKLKLKHRNVILQIIKTLESLNADIFHQINTNGSSVKWCVLLPGINIGFVNKICVLIIHVHNKVDYEQFGQIFVRI